MKKIIYCVLTITVLGISGCKKELNKVENNLTSKNYEGVSLTQKEGVLFFKSWEDVSKIEETLEIKIEKHVDEFEKVNARILKTLRNPNITKSGENNEDVDLIWLADLAVDSLENSLGWDEYQPLIDFENSFNFYSLRKKFDHILYDDTNSSLSDEQRIYYNTFPLSEALTTLFNKHAIIGIGDSIYKVLGNNVWIASLIENKSILEGLSEENYQMLIGSDGYTVYDVQSKKNDCIANRKFHGDETSPNGKYRVYGMLTVTNVGVANGRFIKGRTCAEMRNNKGKWKSRRTYCLVTGGATIRPRYCDNLLTVPGTFYEVHHNRSSRTGRYRSDVLFRVKSGEFSTYHKAGTGSTAVDFYLTLY